MDDTPPAVNVPGPLFGRLERGKKRSPGPDPRFMQELVQKDFADLNQQEVKYDPKTEEYVPRDNFARTKVNPGGRKLIVRSATNSTLKPGDAVPQEPVQFAILTDEYVQIPTNTTEYQRPRTVAAAFDPNLATLTVMFRDSTLYNYYQVDMDEWNTFKNHQSPGQYLISTLNSKPRGPADVDALEPEVLAKAYAVARMAQLRQGYKNSGFRPRSITPRGPYTPRKATKATGTTRNRPGGIVF